MYIACSPRGEGGLSPYGAESIRTFECSLYPRCVISFPRVLAKLPSPSAQLRTPTLTDPSTETGGAHAPRIPQLLVGQSVDDPILFVELARDEVEVLGIPGLIATKDRVGHMVG